MIINRFETVLADTPAARKIHFRVRYRVFCEEARFEEPDRFPDEMERDEHDAHAVHFIIWDRLEREWIGGMRLVSAAHQPLPCETICGSELVGVDIGRRSAVEFSRLCILAKYRKTEAGFKFGQVAQDGEAEGVESAVFFRQVENEVLQRLLRASFAWGKDNAIGYCYFIINRALTRMLSRFGIPLVVVGEPVEHRGLRIPQRYQVDEAQAGMQQNLPGFARMLDYAKAFIPYTEFISQPHPSPIEVAKVYPFSVAGLALPHVHHQPRTRAAVSS